MKRRQLFEFQDEPWFPDLVREGQIEILSLAHRISGFASALGPAFAAGLERTGGPILDLCSGAGSQVTLLLAALLQQGGRQGLPKVLLSDLYPKLPAWRRLKAKWPDHLDFVPQPVDATNLPTLGLDARVVTIINALHHFPLATVRAIMASVIRRGAAMFIAEAFPRSFLRSSVYLLPLAVGVAQNPFVCERHGLAKALLSLPPLPLLTVTGIWDWFASTLRIHEPEELLAVARSLSAGYEWHPGAVAFPPWGKAVYLWGFPHRT